MAQFIRHRRGVEGLSLCPSCQGQQIVDDVEHILLHCGSLSEVRKRLVSFTIDYSKTVPYLSDTLLSISSNFYLTVRPFQM